MNTLKSQQFKHSLSGDSVKQFRTNTAQELTPQQRLEQLEKKFNTVVYFALALGIVLIVTLLNK